MVVVGGKRSNGLEEPWDLAAGGSSRRIGLACARNEISLNTREQAYTKGVIITLNQEFQLCAPYERSFLGTHTKIKKCQTRQNHDRGCLAEK